MAKAVYSLESLKAGAAGANGAMGTSLTDISKIAEGTVTFDFPLPEITNITAEEDDDPFVSLETPQPKTVTFESLDMSLEAIQKAFGGTIATNKLTPGVSFTIPEQSLEIVTRPLQGTKTKWSFPRVKLTASLAGSLQKTDLLRIAYTATVLTPVDASGVKLAPFTVEQLTAA